jgi:hypothetical protein
MAWVRNVASRAHELRAEAKLAVRQTLASVIVTVREAEEAQRLMRQTDLLSLLRDEVNVEEVRVVNGVLEGADVFQVQLDMVITPALRHKGYRREFIRHVMNARKEAGLKPTDRVRLHVVLPTGELHTVLSTDVDSLVKDVRAEELMFVEALPTEVFITQRIKIDEQPLSFALISI